MQPVATRRSPRILARESLKTCAGETNNRRFSVDAQGNLVNTVEQPDETYNYTKSNGTECEPDNFGGSFVQVLLILFLPILTILLNTAVAPNNDDQYGLLQLLQRAAATALGIKSTLSYGIIITVSWISFLIILERVLPAKVVHGLPTASGKRYIYKLNAHLTFWICTLLCSYNMQTRFINYKINLDLVYIHKIYDSLIYAAIIVSIIISLLLYIVGMRDSHHTSHDRKRSEGSSITRFFMGQELNPCIGSFNIKYFLELRPGLLAWHVINLSFSMKRIAQYNEVSPAMALLIVFQGIYIWDAVYNEKAILTTMDIRKERLGFMLVFGNLVWLPFTYTLQTQYLIHHDPQLSNVALCFISLLFSIGLYIFRSSNSQKDLFRRDPQNSALKDLEVLHTKSGPLLVDGWWGKARKINYTGDWLISLSWSLLCGFDSPVPFFNCIYFLILLIHRAYRDDDMCHRKYGASWLKYKKLVPYLFVPNVI